MRLDGIDVVYSQVFPLRELLLIPFNIAVIMIAVTRA
jgi:hypothetical protein